MGKGVFIKFLAPAAPVGIGIDKDRTWFFFDEGFNLFNRVPFNFRLFVLQQTVMPVSV